MSEPSRAGVALRRRDVWLRWACLITPTAGYVALTRAGAESSDGAVALALLCVIVAVVWISYPVLSRFMQVQPTRMTKEEWGLDLLAVAGLALAVENEGLPLVIRLVVAVIASAVLAHSSNVVRQRERDGDVAESFFAD